MAIFSGMRVQASHQNMGEVTPKLLLQVVMEDRDDLLKQRLGNGLRNLCQWQMGGGQSDTQAISRQHHHDAGRLSEFCQKFSMAAEGNARFVDNTFVNRCSPPWRQNRPD